MRRVGFLAVLSMVVVCQLGATAKRPVREKQPVRPMGEAPVAKLATEREAAMCAMLPDGKTVAIGGWGRGILLWDMQSPQAKVLVPSDQTSFAVQGLHVSSDGKLLAMGTGAGEVMVYGLPAGKPAYTTRLCAGSAFGFSPDGRRLAVGTPRGGIELFAAATGMSLTHLAVDGQVLRLAFSPDGQQLACVRTVPGETLLDLISVRDGKVLKNLDKQVRLDHSLEFSADGRWLLLSREDLTRWWDLKEGKQAGAIERCLRASFSPDGTALAAAMADGSLRIIDPASGKVLRRHLRARSKATPVFTPDGKRVVLTDVEGVKVFDVQSMPAGE